METIDPYATSNIVRNGESNIYSEIQNYAFENYGGYVTVQDTKRNEDVPKSIAYLYSVVNKNPR